MSYKILDLEKNYPEYVKYKLQENLYNFYHKFGKDILIKYKNIKFHAKLEKIKLQMGEEIYQLFFVKHRNTISLKPFKIDFIDPIKSIKNNNAYIYNITKTDEINGSLMVEICLTISKILCVQKVYLYDGATVKCNKDNNDHDLSFIKLIEKGKTFYMKMGFDFEVTNNDWIYYKQLNTEVLKKKVKDVIQKIKLINIKDLIIEYEKTLNLLIKIIKNNYEGKLDLIIDEEPFIVNEIYYENPIREIGNLFQECVEVLKILNKYKKEKYFYQILIKTFNDSCDEYGILSKYIVNNTRNKIIYNKKTIKREYYKYFFQLSTYKSVFYSYLFY